mmetsp:Transcript_29765/g.36467  ORF Transcript_29765/g.36467 Transcript_29765/m.36467 type:complete len:253 (+) Transcript_29765:53-811(+)
MGLQPQTESMQKMQNAKNHRYIDKGDLLLLWNTTSPASDGSQSARSTSGSSPSIEDESADLAWNPLGLEAEELSQEDQGESDGEFLWNPLGLKGLKHQETELNFLSKPPGLEEVEGHENQNLWSRSTTAGTADSYESDPVADDVLASEIATVLHMMQTGKCSSPWIGNQMPQRTRTRQSRMPEVRGSPFWPAPGAYLPFAPGQAHFCPWCGSARMIFHKFCPFCGVSYPDVDIQPEPSLEKQFVQYAFGTQM